MRNTIAKWLILIALSAYTVCATAWACSQAHARKCSGIEIEIETTPGPAFVTEKGVLAELGDLPSLYGKATLSDIDTDSLENRLRKNSSFEHVECLTTNEGKLRIRVSPMEPEIRIFTTKGSYYINKEGKYIEASPDFHVDVPIVTGNFSRDFPPSAILPVTRRISRDSLLKDMVTMVKVMSPKNIILVPRIKGHVVNIGDTSDLDRKIENLKLAYSRITPYRGWEFYDTISVKFHNQIVATRRNKTENRQPELSNEEIDLEEASLQGQEMVVTGNETETQPQPDGEKQETDKTKTKGNKTT